MADATEGVVGKPKKPFYKKWWVWLIALLFVGAIASGGSGGGDSTDTATKSESESTKPEAQPASNESEPEEAEAEASEEASDETAKIGTPLKVGDLVFTVKDVKSTKKLKSPLGDKSGNFLIVSVKVANKGKEAVMINTDFFKLVEPDDTTYETDSDNLMYLDSEQGFFLENINPKMDKEGKVLFSVPKGLKDVKLQVQTGVFGTETGLIALTK